jgi:predicted glycosyltransferase
MSGRVFIHVQHLLGTGHLRRAAAIGAALAEHGFEVEIASGGPPIAGLDIGRARLFQLPALRVANADFKQLIDEAGRSVDDAWRSRRRELLLARFESFRPDVLITELFPFGRRALEFELMPLLERARGRTPRPLILCSLRDVLVAPRDPHKVEQAIARARDLYDAIAVHGDPSLIDLPASYPAAAHIADKIAYTGYVTAPAGPEAPPGHGAGEVLVSAGGGAVGARLFETALTARLAGAEAERVWRFLVGGDLPQTAKERLLSPGDRVGIVVEAARPDFPSLLRRCHISISQAGYNTAMDIVDANARAILIPFADNGETEQAQRAAALAGRGWAHVLNAETLDPQRLADAVSAIARGPRPHRPALNVEGARETARLVTGLLTSGRRFS